MTLYDNDFVMSKPLIQLYYTRDCDSKVNIDSLCALVVNLVFNGRMMVTRKTILVTISDHFQNPDWAGQ